MAWLLPRWENLTLRRKVAKYFGLLPHPKMRTTTCSHTNKTNETDEIENENNKYNKYKWASAMMTLRG